jgi:hypothetical protein
MRFFIVNKKKLKTCYTRCVILDKIEDTITFKICGVIVYQIIPILLLSRRREFNVYVCGVCVCVWSVCKGGGSALHLTNKRWLVVSPRRPSSINTLLAKNCAPPPHFRFHWLPPPRAWYLEKSNTGVTKSSLRSNRVVACKLKTSAPLLLASE